MSCGDGLEGRLEIGEGLDVVDFRGLDERCDAAPCASALVMPCEQSVLPVQGQRPFILPMSARSGKFIIVGIPISAGMSSCGR